MASECAAGGAASVRAPAPAAPALAPDTPGTSSAGPGAASGVVLARQLLLGSQESAEQRFQGLKGSLRWAEVEKVYANADSKVLKLWDEDGNVRVRRHRLNQRRQAQVVKQICAPRPGEGCDGRVQGKGFLRLVRIWQDG